MRVALYARVSTEEQARHGLSIDAQIAALRSWAQREGHTIAGEYVDNGVSARKSPIKRPELQRLLSDIAAGDIALVAFTKLDRWTRNIKGYYQVQDVLDAHGVAWAAIHEDYETITASGRFKVNIMLSVAENEADRTSERIKAVNEYKIDRGEVVNGSIPIGYRVEKKRMVLDERADVIRGAFAHYAATGSVHACMDYLAKRGVRLHNNSVCRLLRNPIYKGAYRDNSSFCPPIIPPAEFDAIQAQIKHRSVRCNQTGRIYLFSGLIRCGVCGHAMSGITNNRTYPSYRCTHAAQEHMCTNRHYVNEAKLVDALLPSLRSSLALYVTDVRAQAEAAPADAEKEKAALTRRLDKLKDLYLDDLITRDQYKADHADIMRRLSDLEAATSPAPTFDRALDMIDGGSYDALDREGQRRFWRAILKTVIIPEDLSRDPIKIIFRPD